MKQLIRQATILDTNSPFHKQVVDLLIEDGVIRNIQPSLQDEQATVLEGQQLFVFSGLVDVGVHSGEPGFEHREDLSSLTNAALSGGFTALLTLPNTQPAIHSKTEVKYLLNQSRELGIDIFPLGAISIDCKGKDLTEMIDMFQAGAVAFSDGLHSIYDNGLMMRALQYVKSFNGIVLNRPSDKSIAAYGQMHEGETSTLLGMKGIPAMAEELMVQRDIYLAEYTNSRVHIHNISTQKAVDLIRAAKAKNIPVTASAPVLNLYFTDEDLREFDANLKVLPPFRSATDRDALIQGLLDGTIDMLSSNHLPIEEEGKKLEFPYAEFGTTALENAFALSWTLFQKHNIPLDQLIPLWSTNVREVFGLPPSTIEVDKPANLSVFDAATSWDIKLKDLKSKSKNSPLVGHTLLGNILGTWNKHQSSFR